MTWRLAARLARARTCRTLGAGLAAIAAARAPAATSLLVGEGSPSPSIIRYDGATGDFVDEFVPPGTGGLVAPRGLAWGPDRNLYVSSFDGTDAPDAVLRYDGETGAFIDAFVPAGADAPLGAAGLAFGPDGHLYVCDATRREVRRYDGRTGALIDVFISGAPGLNENLTFGPDGNLYVTANGTGIVRYDAGGVFIDIFAVNGGAIYDLAFGPGNVLFVSPWNQDRVVYFDATSGAALGTFIDMTLPFGLAVGADDDLYVASFSTSSVWKVDGATGEYLETFAEGGGLALPVPLLFVPGPCAPDLDGDGEVAFADLLVLLGAWGPCPVCAADLDGDGSVAFADLLLLLGEWGRCGGA